MQNTDKRIAALESIVVTTGDITIIRRIVSPGQLEAETNRFIDKAEKVWTRWIGETESAFTERATCETAPEISGVKSLIGKNVEICHA